jgi:hypothetical protein
LGARFEFESCLGNRKALPNFHIKRDTTEHAGDPLDCGAPGEYVLEHGGRLHVVPAQVKRTMPNVTYDKQLTALLVIDPYNDFISEVTSTSTAFPSLTAKVPGP